MKRQFDFILMISLVVAACATQGKDAQPSTAGDTPAGPQQLTPSDTGITAIESDPGKADYPYQMEWIPGQRDTGDFDVLSKFRAYAS